MRAEAAVRVGRPEQERVRSRGTVSPLFSPGGEAKCVRGPSVKNGDCHQFAPRHIPRNKVLSLKRIGWLYPIFRW